MAALTADGAESRASIADRLLECRQWPCPPLHPVPRIHPPPAHRLHYEPFISDFVPICAAHLLIIHDERETMSDQAGCRILVISPTAARAHQFVERMHPSRLAPLAPAQ